MTRSAAFIPAPLPGRTSLPAVLPLHTQPRARACPTRMTSGPATPLLARLLARARADTELLRSHLHAASVGAVATCAAAGIAVASVCGPALAEVPEVAPAGAVFDEAGLVQKGSVAQFGKAAEGMSRTAGVRVRFALVRAVPYGETPGEYAAELARAWGLGEEDLLFVASPKLARAGWFAGEGVRARVSEEVVDSIAEETYGVAAGEERYGAALLDVSNRLIPVLAGEKDPGPPDLTAREVVQNYKTKKETSSERRKYVTVVGVVLLISFVAPLIQTYWYVRDD